MTTLSMRFPLPTPGKRKEDGKLGGGHPYLTGDACIALGTLAVLHLGGQGQVNGIWAGCVQRDRPQPADGRAIT